MSRTWHEVDTPEPGDFFLSRATRRWLQVPLQHATGVTHVHGGVYVGLGRHLVVNASVRHRHGAELGGARALSDPRWFRVDDLDRWDRADVAAEAELIAAERIPFPSVIPFAIGLIRRHHGDVTAPYWSQPWWVRQLLNGRNTVYCLQVIERAYREAGFPLFDDGRPEGLVTPRCLLDRVAAA